MVQATTPVRRRRFALIRKSWRLKGGLPSRFRFEAGELDMRGSYWPAGVKARCRHISQLSWTTAFCRAWAAPRKPSRYSLAGDGFSCGPSLVLVAVRLVAHRRGTIGRKGGRGR